MSPLDVQDMGLTADASLVCTDLVRLGAVPTSGHRSVAGQARAMAVNVAKNRDWIGQTYRRGAYFQALVDQHPEWVTATRIGEGLYQDMTLHPELVKGLSHHLMLPSPCFDLDPESVNDGVRGQIEAYQQEGVITKVLWVEGGIRKTHIEVGHLPTIKVVEV